MIQKSVIRCRAIIVHEGKLLVVRLSADSSFAALPGGHLEWGESVKTCLHREIIEELGVEPVIGRLLYINSFVDSAETHSTEFFFEVTNGADFVDCDKRERTHAYEISEIAWIRPTDEINLLPKQVMDDFRAGTLISDSVRYLC